MSKYIVDLEEYARRSRKAAAEGAVLLENRDNALPVKKGEKVSIFGRIQYDYYKSGTGSGGMVHTRHVVNIIDGLRANTDISVNEDLAKIYADWIAENPYDKGQGWAGEPWSQKEMPLSDEVVENASKVSDLAVVVIGRSAGEDNDSSAEAGSYLLTETEKDMIAKTAKYFKRTAIVLNVGNIIDMSWVEEYRPAAVLYTWQGGEEGGNAVADVLTGTVNPCGKLTDTIAKDYKDYPSTANFGGDEEDVYKEDIFVGYRYFETFARDKVVYPFGYGLSYTDFEISDFKILKTATGVKAECAVKNTGDCAGKEVVQIYLSKPNVKLTQPAKELVGYRKTKLLAPGEHQDISVDISFRQMASYDDSGVSGHEYSWLMEAGSYKFYAGNSVRDEKNSASVELEEKILEKCQQAMAPVASFERMINRDGKVAYEPVNTRKYDLAKRIAQARPQSRPCSKDKGFKLADVYDGKVSAEEFLDQLTDEELSFMTKGEGMCSPKVTPGCGGAIGGLTPELSHYGIPVICVTDGPSGIRMDCGTKAFSLPNGTCLACTFDPEINEELFDMLGLELRKNKIDALLGPGMNIHRNPLNGRNFEYFSEDPLVSGTIGAAQIRGLHHWGVTGTIKHFCANNQEHHRRLVNSIVSERALREIYLKGFEIVVKEADGDSIMTTYGRVNGIWTAGNYDQNTLILREEWGFKGIVMTDWWAEMNEDGEEKSDINNLRAMVRAQNDCYMVCDDTKTKANNIMASLEDGSLTRGELLRVGKNIIDFIMTHHVMDRYLDRVDEEEKEDIAAQAKEDEMPFDLEFQNIDKDTVIDVSKIDTGRDGETMIGIEATSGNVYNLKLKLKANGTAISQMPMTISVDGNIVDMVTFNGTNGEIIEHDVPLGCFGTHHFVKFFFGEAGIELVSGEVKQISKFELPFQ